MFNAINRVPLLWLSLLLLLNGCSLLQKKQTPQTAEEAKQAIEASNLLHDQHMVLMNSIQQFALKGRLGVMTKPKGFSGRVNWQHSPDSDHIDVFSPLGGKVAYITKTLEAVILTNSKDEQVSAEDTETLTEKTLGFRLPLSGLSYWALGRPSNTGLVEYITWDNQGRITEMQQNGWDISYQDYNMQEGYFLPRKITLRTDTLIIKIIAEKWSDIQTR